MKEIEWMAVLSAGFAVWLWLPPDVSARLGPVVRLRLPRWAAPLPGAMEPRKRWWLAGGLTLLLVGYGWRLSWLVVLLGPVVAVGLWLLLGRIESGGARRDRLVLLDDLPEALDLTQASVRAGQPLRNAIGIVTLTMGGPVARLLGTVTNAVSVGMSDAQAWQTLRDDPLIGFVARDLARSSAWGTSVVEVLAGHSRDLRRQSKASRLSAAKAVGVKTVLPLGLCYLPAFILLGVVPIVAGGVAAIFD